MSAEKIWQRLVGLVTNGESNKIAGLATEFDSEAMDGEEYPEEFFEVLLRILDDPNMQRSKEIFNFLVDISPDMDRLSENQLGELYAVISKNIEKFSDSMLVHTAVDLVCRYYSKDHIVSFLDLLFRGNLQNKHAFIGLGISVARLNGKIDEREATKLISELR